MIRRRSRRFRVAEGVGSRSILTSAWTKTVSLDLASDGEEFAPIAPNTSRYRVGWR